MSERLSQYRERLKPGGGVLVADIIEPATRQIADLFARQYHNMVYRRSICGIPRRFERVRAIPATEMELFSA